MMLMTCICQIEVKYTEVRKKFYTCLEERIADIS